MYLVSDGGGSTASCLTAFDVAEKKQLWSAPSDTVIGWCVAADGKSVVVVTQKVKGEEVAVHARRLDTKAGKEFGAIKLKDVAGFEDGGFSTLNERGEIHFHPDGKTVSLINKEGRTVAIDVATWKTVATKENLVAHSVLSPDGRMTLSPSGRHVVIHETDTGKRLSPAVGGFPYPDHNTWLLFSPASERLTRRGHTTDETVLEWDITTGRQTRRIEKRGDPSEEVTLSADGTKKAVLKKVAEEWQVTITNVSKPNDPPADLKAGWGDRGWPYRWTSFTPDTGHFIGYDSNEGIHIWDTKTGGKPVEVKLEKPKLGWGLDDKGIRITADGRRVAVVEWMDAGGRWSDPATVTWRVGVYAVPSGKLIHRFDGKGWLDGYEWIDDRITAVANLSNYHLSFFGGPPRPPVRKFGLLGMDPAAKTMREHSIDVDVRAWAAVPFGDTVAVGSSDGLRLYEASTGKLRHTFREQKRPVEVLAFSPNGWSLAAESVDGPLLVWDVRGDLTKPAKPDAAGWDRAWEALASTDAEKGFQAVRMFALHPEDGVAELKRRFAESQPSAEEIATAIAKLDDREFAVRLRAEKQLRAMGTAAFPALNKAMDREPSEEFKVRAERLLAVDVPADRQRAERAVEALRLADTESARKQVAEWAKGPEKDPLTVAAKRR